MLAMLECFRVYLGERPLQDGPVRVLPLHVFARELAAGRMLVAQCLAEPLVLLTNDGVLADYGDVVKVVSRRPREITSTIDRPARRLSDSSA